MSLIPNPLQQINANALAQASQQSQNDVQELKKLMPQTQEASNQSPNSGMPQPPEGYIRSLMQIGNMHAANQAAAQQKLGQYDQMTQAGFYIDGKAWRKAYKQAGIKIDTSPEGIQQAVSFFKQYNAEKDPVSGQAQQMPPEITAMMEKAQNGQLSKHDVTRFVTGAAIRSEMRSDRWARADQLQKEAFQRQTMDWLKTATDDKASPRDRGEAIGKLTIALPDTYGKMSIDDKTFALATPEQKQLLVGKAIGEETSADIHARADRLYETNLQTGMGADNARKAADAQAEGKPLPAGVNLPEITPQNLAMTMETAGFAAEKLGLSGQGLTNFVHSSMQGGLDAAMQTLPKSFQTIAQQQLALQQKELNLSQQRLGIEGSQLQVSEYEATTQRIGIQASVEEREAQAAHLGMSLQNDRDKNLLDQFAILSKLKSQNGTTKELEDQLLNGMAANAGMKVERVVGLFHNYYDFKPGQVDTSQYAGGGGPHKSRQGQAIDQQNPQAQPSIPERLENTLKSLTGQKPQTPKKASD